MDPVIVIFGFGVGFLVGLTGMGGGSIMTPALVLVFGIKPVTAIGTDIAYSAVTKVVGAWRHLKLKTVNRGLVFWLAIGSVPSALAGVWAISVLRHSLGKDLDKTVFAILAATLLVVGVATLLRGFLLADKIDERADFTIERRHKIAAVAIGATTGFVIGITSAGSGTLIGIMLIAGFRLTPQRVVGTDVTHAAVLLWEAAIAHTIGGNVDFGLAGNILVGSIPGVIAGSQLSVRWPKGLLRTLLGLVLVAAGLTILNKASADVVPYAIAVAAVAIVGLSALQIWLQRNVARRRSESASSPPEPAYSVK
jgi:uncharacterized protein